MSSLTQDLVREVMHTLVSRARNGDGGLTQRYRHLLSELDALELERVIGLIASSGEFDDLVKVDIDAIFRVASRVRARPLVADLLHAGASNRLLVNLFGYRMRDIRDFRKEYKTPGKRSRALTREEEDWVRERIHERPPESNGSLMPLTLWCLDATRESGLPLMAIHSYLTQMGIQS